MQVKGNSIRTIAVDWSGAASGARRKIWLAEVRNGTPIRLESGRTREQLVNYLVEAARDDPGLVVGLDFAFSLPSWFLDERHLTSGRELWRIVEERGEEWLERCEPPFWGRPGTTKPDLPEHFRQTERAVHAETNSRPKSPFQIGGAGAVGTASIRGMPHLRRLSDEGFSVWPFEEASLPLVIEIYPRLFTGAVVKSDPEARRRYLAREHPDLPDAWSEQAAESDDAFDAAVSALTMDTHAEQLRNLSQPQNLTLRREGIIWRPGHSWASHDGLDEALVYALRLHADQRRKGPDGTPYIAHLLGVCSLVLEAGGDEDQAIAALLHDAAEDQGGLERLRDVRDRFGRRATEIVEACTDTFEDPKPDWHPRKERYVADLAEEPADALLVACADKLYNARSILRDQRRVGDRVFERFTGGKEGTLWYYRALVDAFRRSALKSWLVDELDIAVEELEERAG